MNNLPKYWVVKRDDTNPNWQKVIDYLNKTYGVNYVGYHDAYYGYDGNDRFNGTNWWRDISKFENNPTELTIDEFVAMTEDEQFTRGEKVDTRDYDHEDWRPRIYVTTAQGAKSPYLCVSKKEEELFKSNEPFEITAFRQIRRLQQPKTVLTRQEIADKFGVPVEQLEIKD